MKTLLIDEVSRRLKSGEDIPSIVQIIYQMGYEEGYLEGVKDMENSAKKVINDTFCSR